MIQHQHTISILCVLATGCAALLTKDPAPKFDEPTYQGLADDRPATIASEVKVLTVFNIKDELPEGVTLVGGDHLAVAPGFPSAEDPHVILGILRMEDHGDSPNYRSRQKNLEYWARVREEAQAKLAAEAARHGANAIFVQSKGGKFAAQAIYLSSSEASHPRADNLLAEIKAPTGYRRVANERRDLASFEPITVKSKARTCYSLVFALDGDAKLGRYTRRGFYIELATRDPLLREKRFATPVFGKGRSHVQDIGCGRDATPLTLSLRASAIKGDSQELGSGQVVVQVYAKQIGKGEMSQIIERRNEGWRQTRLENCEHCYFMRVRCGEEDVRKCPRYLKCLRSRGETPNTCRKLKR